MDTHVNHEAKRPKTLQVVPKFWAQFRILWTSIIALGRTTNANDECDDHDFDADAHDNAKIEIISMIVVTLVMLILTGCFWWWTRMHFQPSWVNPDQIVSDVHKGQQEEIIEEDDGKKQENDSNAVTAEKKLPRPPIATPAVIMSEDAVNDIPFESVYADVEDYADIEDPLPLPGRPRAEGVAANFVGVPSERADQDENETSDAAYVNDATIQRVVAMREAKQGSHRRGNDASKWSPIECLEWLTENNLEDFRELFYNNGFEGSQLVQMTIGTFANIKSVPQTRCKVLVSLVEQLIEHSFKTDTLPPIPKSTSAQNTSSNANNTTADSDDDDDDDSDVDGGNSKGPNQRNGRPPQRRDSIDSEASLDDIEATNRQWLSARIHYTLELPTLDRELAKKILRAGDKAGEFLVRRGRNGNNVLTLTTEDHNVKSLNLIMENGEYVTKDGNKFPSLEKLISYFTTSTSGDLPCKLTSYTTHFDEEIEQILGQGATYENTDLL